MQQPIVAQHHCDRDMHMHKFLMASQNLDPNQMKLKVRSAFNSLTDKTHTKTHASVTFSICCCCGFDGACPCSNHCCYAKWKVMLKWGWKGWKVGAAKAYR